MKAKEVNIAPAAVTLDTNVIIISSPSRVNSNLIEPNDMWVIACPDVIKGKGTETMVAHTEINSGILHHVRIGERVSKISMTLTTNISTGSVNPLLKATVPVSIKAETTAIVGLNVGFNPIFNESTVVARISKNLAVRLFNFASLIYL